MKKSVFLIIMAIFVASVVLVGYYGVKSNFYKATIYVEKIECINEEVVKSKNTGANYIRINNFKPENPVVVQLRCKVYPEDANKIKLSYNIITNDESDLEFFTVTEYGLVTIKKTGSFTVYINSTDGSNKREEVRFIVYKN